MKERKHFELHASTCSAANRISVASNIDFASIAWNHVVFIVYEVSCVLWISVLPQDAARYSSFSLDSDVKSREKVRMKAFPSDRDCILSY